MSWLESPPAAGISGASFQAIIKLLLAPVGQQLQQRLRFYRAGGVA
jgi:hypothetical protein